MSNSKPPLSVVGDTEVGNLWADKTPADGAASLTVADLHAILGRLAREVRILSIVVAILGLITIAGWLVK